MNEYLEKLKQINIDIKTINKNLVENNILILYKIPPLSQKILIYINSMSWRFIDFCESAYENYKNEKITVAISLTRNAFETIAGLWYINKKINTMIETNNLNLKEDLMKLIFGNKLKNQPKMPEAINIKTFIQQIDKEVTGFLFNYENLCEISHPNYAGTIYSYANINAKKYTVKFGKNIRQNYNLEKIGINNLSNILNLYIYLSNNNNHSEFYKMEYEHYMNTKA